MRQHTTPQRAGARFAEWTALVTGASGGLGEQFARQLAARGAGVVLVARSEAKLQDLAGELGAAYGITTTVIAADLSQPGAADAVAERLAAAGLQIDVLVNNAGVGSHRPVADDDPERLTAQIQLNCTALVGLTGRLLPGMLARRRGGVLNVASTAAFQPVPTMAVYAASKAFVLSFTEALWQETRTSAVRVLALCPGPTDTAFFATAAADTPFLTSGRKDPARVAAAALHAFEHGRGPCLIPGIGNRLAANGYRFMPRALMPRLAQHTVRAT